MLTYQLKKTPGVPLYEALYRCIRGDILSGKLSAGEKLPSKRALSEHLEISKLTVETAYSQLLQEGFIVSRERVGYFVEELPRIVPGRVHAVPELPVPACTVDLTGSTPADFPFSVWSRLQREVMLDIGPQLLRPMPPRGIRELRCAIAAHLAQFRGMTVAPEHVLIGAGTDFLYNLLIQLLGRDKCYALEEPGYGKIRKLYAAAGAKCISVPMDKAGVCPNDLSNAQVLHISPNHHFPTGVVTPMSRRRELLSWAAADSGRYIIEDDYDSEFRFDAHPMPSLYSMDRTQRVIYMNTFSRSLAPGIRIGYMVLPAELMERFSRDFSFYSCTVPSFEQHTLARFIEGGWFEKHINRMRRLYKTRRDRVMALLDSCPVRDKLTVREENAGVHFLLYTHLTDEQLDNFCRERGIRVRTLSSYCHGCVPPEQRGCLVVNYGTLTEQQLQKLKLLLKW